MICNNNKILVLLVILDITALCIDSAPLSGENVKNVGELNGEKLMEIGKELKLPILQMIGKTINNIGKETELKICKQHQCSDWTVWSSCTARVGQFGSKFRTRQCSVNMTSCEIDSNSRTEKEFGICIMDMTCPNGYNLTKNGFCMKFYSDIRRTKDAAEQQCQKDGGYLVNIDSELKSEDVGRFLTDFKRGGGEIWGDGHRKDVTSTWEYTYGSPKGFFEWFPGEPRNITNHLCLVVILYSGRVKWNSGACTGSYFTICEIVKSM